MLTPVAQGTYLLVARHGATDTPGAQSGFGTPAHDPPLSPAGRVQAEAFALALAAHLPASMGLWVSPRLRTQQTAAPLAAALQQTPQVLPGLDEIDYGQWAGRSRQDIARVDAGAALQRWDACGQSPKPAAFVPSDTEANQQAQRLAEALFAQHAHACVFSHNGRVRAFSSLAAPDAGVRRRLACGHMGVLWRPAEGGGPWQQVAWDVPPADVARHLSQPRCLWPEKV